VRSSRTKGLRSLVANRAVFFVSGSSLNAIQLVTHAEQLSNKKPNRRSDRRQQNKRHHLINLTLPKGAFFGRPRCC
jgi:hypothetical protein